MAVVVKTLHLQQQVVLAAVVLVLEVIQDLVELQLQVEQLILVAEVVEVLVDQMLVALVVQV